MRRLVPSWRWNGPAIPKTKPIIRALYAGEDGRIWVQLHQPGRRIVDERVWVTVYRGSELGRIMDFELSWEATEEPVGIQGSANIKGYGGFSLRFAPFEGPVITTSGGVQSDDSNRVPFAWADLSARFGGSDEYAGAAIFDHEGNIDFPNGWCLRHYGFLGVAWPGNNPYLLQPGKPLVLRYRVWVNRGDAEKGRVSAAYKYYTRPIEAAIVE